jgi:hypothetical protein
MEINITKRQKQILDGLRDGLSDKRNWGAAVH